MANFEEQNTQPYDWENEGVYIIQNEDYVEGGQDGVSNRQAKELTKRTRNLHKRMSTAEGEIDDLQADVPIKVEAALRTAKDYTDAKDSVVRRDMATADTATLRSAKDYADTIVAALVDNSPEALNTLQELAVAMGNDPNFATTVMQQIGERAKTSDVNAALAGKADAKKTICYSGTTINGNLDDYKSTGYYFVYSSSIGTGTLFVIAAYENYTHPMQIFVPYGSSGMKNRSYNSDNTTWSPWVEFYHSGNFDPADKANNDSVIKIAPRFSGTWGNCAGFMENADAPVGQLTSFISFGYKAYEIQLALGGYSAWLGGWNRLFFRSRNGDDDSVSNWKEIYHTGNLTPATTAATGLMSADDKTKLDSMQCGVLGGGRVYANGGSSNYGRIISAAGAGVQGQYQIVHNLGHTDYSLTGNVFYGGIAAFVMILTKGVNDIVVEVRDVQSHPQRLDFMYTISGRL